MKRTLVWILAVPALALAQAEPEWLELQTHGFSVEPRGPLASSARVERWPGLGLVELSIWELHTQTPERAHDVITCVTARGAQRTLLDALHSNFCRGDRPGQLRWDDPLGNTGSFECLVLRLGPDGERRDLFRIVPVGTEVCVVSSSERVAGVTDQASIAMAHFVGSFHAVKTEAGWVDRRESARRGQSPRSED
jgi:hypothetical protein